MAWARDYLTLGLLIALFVTEASLNADPSLAGKEPDLVAEFEAAPWLLPPRCDALPYAGVRDLDRLLQLRAVAAGGHPKTITLIPYSLLFVDMLQNAIYSMVKFGRVRNYIVLAWSPRDLDSCADLNLPCADATRFLPTPLDNGPDAGHFGTHDYLSIVWLKPAVTLYTLQQGYVTFMTDADVSYANKPVLESFLELLAVSKADAAFQAEGPLNTGVYAILANPAGIALAQKWADGTPAALNESRNDNQALAHLNGQIENSKQTMALMRLFNPAHFPYSPDYYAFIDMDYIPRIDPCDWTALFVHMVSVFKENKREGLRRMGWWYLDSDTGRPCAPRQGGANAVPICQPRQWRLPDTEQRLYNCGGPLGPLGLVHPGERAKHVPHHPP
ncbi:hypothetical protein CHLNCDRAFT_133996 [Chlorella variabilis]|uniref:Nucleotide-diphospho-sugar transferase domain-containing protein n=1 Tax=Chlorella variabilis TaxID=554065 RepID=E1ZER5_CHLVA|nr:hypothetical protein CHLNCDRAFT_133996 [Chlorella variabilis]EFN55545.1 hypothetical protein CHLNCDRAFT_133996 [Chlorella variabilis]|eukprot:XP_005847647.1 hypothetical protein CHLNCDRAFT_133996 [Chlorella variabilis]